MAKSIFGKRRNQRGATSVEAGLALPIVMMLTFASLDGALYMKDLLSTSTAARNGARSAAAAADNGYADYRIIQAVKKNSSGFAEGSIDRIIIYRAANRNDVPHADCATGTGRPSDSNPSTDEQPCNVYVPSDLNRPQSDFDSPGFAAPRFWPAAARNAARSTGTDLIGVQIISTARTPIGILGSQTFEIRRSTVMQIEARQS